MKKERIECCGYNKPKGLTGVLFKAHHKEHFKCHAKASVVENEKHYCKRHAPSEIKKREEKSWNNYISKISKP